MTSAIETIRNRKELFLISGLPTAEAICLLLVNTVLADNVGPVRAYCNGGFYFVAANKNWVIQNYKTAPYVFDHLVPLHGQQNTFRGEILLPAFAAAYAFIERGKVVNSSDDSMQWGDLLEVAGNVGCFCAVFRV